MVSKIFSAQYSLIKADVWLTVKYYWTRGLFVSFLGRFLTIFKILTIKWSERGRMGRPRRPCTLFCFWSVFRRRMEVKNKLWTQKLHFLFWTLCNLRFPIFWNFFKNVRNFWHCINLFWDKLPSQLTSVILRINIFTNEKLTRVSVSSEEKFDFPIFDSLLHLSGSFSQAPRGQITEQNESLRLLCRQQLRKLQLHSIKTCPVFSIWFHKNLFLTVA